MNYVLLFALLGIAVSLFGLLLDFKVKADPNFKAACDISERSSCTKTLKSKYSRILFGISNTYFGILFFGVIAWLAYVGGYQHEIFYSAAVGTLVSLWLALVIYFKQKNYCSLCIALVIISAVLTFLTAPF